MEERRVERLVSFEGRKESCKLESRSPAETLELGALIGGIVPEGCVMSFEGGLGAGKTLLAKGLCLGLGVRDEVVSPSFILVEEYRGVMPVMHFDLYRLERVEEVYELGLFEVDDGHNVIIVEWGDRLPEGILRPDIRVILRITGGEGREILIEAPAELIRAVEKEEC
jgi:tRNA threonylcarbamoyladenosine biosynthesis protein TsaE